MLNHPRYGLPSAVDVGGTAMTTIPGCVLANSDCIESPGSTVEVSPLATSVSFTLKYTSMNMRDAWPNSSIPVAVWFSRDSRVDGSDVRAFNISQGNTFAGAIYTYSVNLTFNPWFIPNGENETWCVLLKWDPDNTVAEYDETDNVTDTQYCFHRQ